MTEQIFTSIVIFLLSAGLMRRRMGKMVKMSTQGERNVGGVCSMHMFMPPAPSSAFIY